ncbi:hypothetical protein KTO58_06530 [Chitinophaga pendula]|uniref:toxin-antitoxin system YwqK family antitoxin n=1 Tax=Chitinophaga TaxID=79328 RepID=UPI000BB07E63|nr:MULTISPECIES: hypothetical protein [Chitinophaga]ASZ13529.1 hypothetical protein CK934_22530 [Chitinophaga sp. MD30]ASZ13568.1 hypothetical protein CK934_22755 [Chitinophaga sp. MD30]UCJ08839.1 hypothetical protein KTO58_06530 [Chitinophaga pendula]
MNKWILCLLLQGVTLLTMAQQPAPNQTDAQKRKQGHWIEEIPGLRGEPGYSWEGDYKNGRKEGLWKKYAETGALIAQETFKNNVLDGYCTYYYTNGKKSAEGLLLATEIEGQRDTIMVIDPVTSAETPTVIVRMGNAAKHGLWKMYDEEGHMTKEYYKRGEPVTAEEMGAEDTTTAPATSATTAPKQSVLPHEKQNKKATPKPSAKP